MKFELQWAAPSIPAQTNSWIPWTAALLLLAGALAWTFSRSPRAEPRQVVRWTATLPAPSFSDSGLALSRDGTRLAYNGGPGSSTRIWLRSLDQAEWKPIPGTEGGQRPFFSPDGRWLAYFQGRMGPLKKVPLTGGTPITLCERATFRGGSWGEDDRIIFNGSSGGLMRVSSSGGACESLTTTDPQKGAVHSFPQVLPGGQSILFTIGTFGSFDRARIAVLDLKSGGIRVLVNGGTYGRYVPSGHLVYVRGGAMFAVPFDLKRLVVTGGETPVIEGVLYSPGGGFADYTLSDSGLLVYMADKGAEYLRALEWRDRKGTSQASPAPPQDYRSVRLSPDGRRAAVGVLRVGFDIWILELARGAPTRLTTEGVYINPVWAPDSRQLVFAYGPFGTRGLYRAPSDGSSKPEPRSQALAG